MSVTKSGITKLLISPAGKKKQYVFIETRTTKVGDRYDVDVLQYSNASGASGKIIATRNSEGDFTWKENNFIGNLKDADSNQLARVSNVSSNQGRTIISKQGDISSLEKTKLNNAAGFKNLAKSKEGNDEISSKDQEIAAGKSDWNNKMMKGLKTQGIGRKSYGNYCYPTTLRRSQQDVLRISVLKYKPKSFDQKNLSFGARDSGTSRTIGSVTLPVNKVTDQNQTDWGESRMNAGQIALANIALGGIMGGGAGLMGAAKESSEAIRKGGSDVKQAIAQYFVGQATQVKGILARTQGAVINPNMELIFNGPQLRPFSFTYRLSARDAKESGEIGKIIRLFKQSMAVQTTDSAIFLKAPNTYKLQFLTAGHRKHKFLPRIKECALTGFNVDYVPEGSYMTYENGSMVAYEITFSFKELEPIYNADYGNLGGSEYSDLNGRDAGVGF